MTIMKSLFGSAKTPGGRASTRAALAALVAFCLAVPMAHAADSLTMADFNHKIKLQVDGYTGTETLVDFPVLVRISESGIPGFLLFAAFFGIFAWNAFLLLRDRRLPMWQRILPIPAALCWLADMADCTWVALT